MKRNTKANNISVIFKKEMRRFFGDKRLVLALLLPGLMLYIVYSLMGNYMSNAMNPDENYTYKVYAENLPASADAMLKQSGLDIEFVEKADKDADISGGDLDLYAVFPEKFDELVAMYQTNSGEKAPHVQLYYNSSEPNSYKIYSIFRSMLDSYESMLSNKFDVNMGQNVKYDLATEGDFTEMMFSTMMPMLLIVLVFSACMSLVPESFAGEKERGTIATLLVTPMKRSHLAIGKITALSTIALLSGICSFIGVLFALPKLTGDANSMDTSIYGAADYLCILAIILSTVLFFSSLTSVVSTLAKTVKEAMSYVSPLMIIITILGMSRMFTDGATPKTPFFLIPAYNSVQALGGIFSLSYEPIMIVLTVISNIVFSGVLMFVLTRMFNSEKVMFKK